jgi:high affinity Mn2+ porin
LSRAQGGQFNDRPQQIFESCYAYSIDQRFTFTADYPPITNPAYNADRCPVSVFSGWLLREF